jgi:transposase
MITGLPVLNRYLDDAQWKAVSAAIREAGGRTTDGNRLHIDAALDLMKQRIQWRDLDYRYGPWAAVHVKFVRWYETGILHGIVQALFKLGLTEEWRPTYTEISSGPSAISGPKLRPLMAQIVVELRQHREAHKSKPGRKPAPVLTQPKGSSARDKVDEYKKKVKEAVKARKNAPKDRLTDLDWAFIVGRLPDMESFAQQGARRQIDELNDVMRTNKSWNYMDPRVGTPSAVYARFVKWAQEGTMKRLVKCLAELGLTKDWSQFLVAPAANGTSSLKQTVGAEAALYLKTPKKRDSTKAKAVKKAVKNKGATAAAKAPEAVKKPAEPAKKSTAKAAKGRRKRAIKAKTEAAARKALAAKQTAAAAKPKQTKSPAKSASAAKRGVVRRKMTAVGRVKAVAAKSGKTAGSKRSSKSA